MNETTNLMINSPAMLATRSIGIKQLVQDFYSSLGQNTLRSYQQGWSDFALYLEVPTVDEAARSLLALPAGQANALVLRYRNSLAERKLSPATTNSRLAAIKSLCKLAKLVGLVDWTIDVRGLRSETLRDCRGPGEPAYRRLLTSLAERGDAKALRDAAICRLAFERGLRRAEIVSLHMADLDLERNTVMVLGKGKLQKEPLTVAKATVAALRAWIEQRGQQPGPVFLNISKGGKHFGGRLTGTGLWKALRDAGKNIGRKVRPHGLRHSGVTRALDLSGGDVRAVQRWARHSSPTITMKYDDSRQDLAGRIAELIAGD